MWPSPQQGRYWIVAGDGQTAGVVVQSPLDFGANITPMVSEAIRAVLDAIVESEVGLPSVNAEAATAGRFTGH